MLIMRLTVLLVLFVFLVNTALHRPPLESFLFAVALAVGLTPELLPMVVSVTLARGALRMAGKKVIVKRLAAIHDLGSMDVLCTDKTGTLTEARIRLERHLDAHGRDSDARAGAGLPQQLLRDRAEEPARRRHPRATEDRLADGWRKIDEVPFDFERRRVSVLLDDGATARCWWSRARSRTSLRCRPRYEGDGPDDLRPLDAARARGPIEQRSRSLCREGFRVLGIAWRAVAHGRRSCRHRRRDRR